MVITVQSEIDFNILITGVRDGDTGAIRDLWAIYNPIMLRYASVLSRDLADDICQDSWIAIARNIHRFKGDKDQFVRYIFTIARNRATDYARAGYRRDNLARHYYEMDTARAGVDIDNEYKGESAELARYLQTLSPLVAEMIFLKFAAGLTTEEISDFLGRSQANVRVAIHRGLAKLRDHYAIVRDAVSSS